MLKNPYTSEYDPGNFFLEQARESLKGSYVPKEDIYCIACPEKRRECGEIHKRDDQGQNLVQSRSLSPQGYRIRL